MSSVFLLCDIETTGFNPRKDKIIEIALLRIQEWEIVERFESLVNPGMPLTDNIKKITGLDDQELKESPTYAELANGIKGFIGKAHTYCWSAFDERFLIAHDRRLSRLKFVDYMSEVKKKPVNFSSYQLCKVAHELGIPVNKSHRAMADAVTLYHIIRKLR